MLMLVATGAVLFIVGVTFVLLWIYAEDSSATRSATIGFLGMTAGALILIPALGIFIYNTGGSKTSSNAWWGQLSASRIDRYVLDDLAEQIEAASGDQITAEFRSEFHRLSLEILEETDDINFWAAKIDHGALWRSSEADELKQLSSEIRRFALGWPTSTEVSRADLPGILDDAERIRVRVREAESIFLGIRDKFARG